MTNTLLIAGAIVHDTDGVIHGVGHSAEDAWADMLITMQNANIQLLDDDEDSDGHGSWTRMSDLKIAPATAALLQRVKDYGGDCSWGRMGALACTVDEELA